MKKQPVPSTYSLALTRSVDGVNRIAEKFFNLEKHPRQKDADYPPIIFTPLLFL